MVLVHHQIPHGEIGEALQPLAVGLGRRLWTALFAREGRPLGEDGEAAAGKLQPRRQRAHGDEDIPRFGQIVQAVVHRHPQLLLPQTGLKLIGRAGTARQNHHGVALPAVVQKILLGGLQTQAVAGELLHQKGEQVPGREGIVGAGEGIQKDHGPGGQAGEELLIGAGEDTVPALQNPLLQEGFHILLQLPQVGVRPFRQAGGLAGQQDGMGGQIVRGGSKLGVDLGKAPVGGAG